MIETLDQGIICIFCGVGYSANNDDDNGLCDTCQESTDTCEGCGNRDYTGDMFSAPDDLIVCHRCWIENYIRCSDCGDFYLATDVSYIRSVWPEPRSSDANRTGYPTCDSCLDKYSECPLCGDVVHAENAYFCDRCEDYHCENCGSYCDSHNIHDYGYKPRPKFIGTPDDRLYLGVELEIDQGNIDVTGELTGIDPNEDLFYLKEDGSLGSSGVEIVTHPATLEAHLDGTIPWESIIATAKEFGYTSHSAKTCGLHVHLSRDGLGETTSDQDATLSNMILLLWRHWPNIQNLSRRTLSQLHWCQPNWEDNETAKFWEDEGDNLGIGYCDECGMVADGELCDLCEYILGMGQWKPANT
jgi:hypothetical protein